MKKTVSLTLALTLSAGLLAGCSGGSDPAGSGSSEKRVVNVCSWGEYIDESLIDEFEHETGIEVNYQTVPSNEELYSMLKTGGANYRDALGIALMDLNYSVNTDSEEELRAAYDLLAQAKEAGVYQAFVMDEVFDKMETGEAAISAYYAGDYLTMLETNPDLKYVVPEEGSNWFVDAMCVLKDAENKDEAEEWINFLCSTDASLKNMDYIWYASPNKEALEQYPEYYEETYGEELDPELYEIMATPQEVLKNCEAYLVRPAATRTLYNDLWTDLGILA